MTEAVESEENNRIEEQAEKNEVSQIHNLVEEQVKEQE